MNNLIYPQITIYNVMIEIKSEKNKIKYTIKNATHS